ncbi:cell division protein FtsA [Clostridium brassicae]|uniref:Rod shape-determining protein n=1 Tax=Clostridium brassicae TaxID=2999072 RepID=A0ABT4D5U7_9CLOT|nr:cell division FtsA domain-containing protein [Clostridium brassicae]MCY6957671.1 rod shape-determining protein [Clostridium brassicae]
MDLLNINPKDVIFALDIGTRSIIGTVGMIKDKKFNVICDKYIEHEERAMVDGQIHDINLVASTVRKVKKELEKEINIPLGEVAIAAAGRFLRTVEVKVDLDIDESKEIDKEIIRSLELTGVKRAEEEVNKSTKGKLYCVGYSVKNYYLNGYVISNLISQKGDKISADLIVTFLPRSVVDSLYSVIEKVDLKVNNLTLEPIAAIEAVIPKKLRLLNLALVDVGAGTSDIAISSNNAISAYGMVPVAGDEITECIVQNYLVDFNTAEDIKRQCSCNDIVKYTDILGMENEVTSDQIIKTINPFTQKLCNEVANKIVELNGGKAPNAVFLVGGGAHTPNFKDFLAEKLNLPYERIAIKGRDAVIDCITLDDTLGSVGVTVIGIALIRIKQSGTDFINVTLNDEVISLFNSHKHTVMDAMIQAGINHKMLMAKNGKNIRFLLNGIKRVAFGSFGEGAVIKVNDVEANIDSNIGEGDNIEIIFAKDGKEASPKLIEYVKKINSLSFYLNDVIHNLDPVGFINKEIVDMEQTIKEEDEVEIIFPSTLGEYIEYYEDDKEQYVYYLKDKEIFKDYIIKEGDRIYKRKVEYINNEESNIKENEIDENNINGENKVQHIEDLPQNDLHNTDTFMKTRINNECTVNNADDEAAIDNIKEDDNIYIEKKLDNINEKENNNQLISKKSDEENLEEQKNSDLVKVIVNDKPVVLEGKQEYIFIDIFSKIQFDLSVARGKLILTLNDKKAGYYDKLKNGDVIRVYWDVV